MKLVIGIIGILLLINTNVYAQALITPGVPVTSNTSLTVANGTSFAIPQGRGGIITWQSSFAVAPTSITLQLQFSLDNSSYFSVDTSSSTTGELRYLGPISARFVRCAVTAVNAGAGSGFQCKINVLAFNNTAGVSGGTFTSNIVMANSARIRLIDGTEALPALAFNSNTGTGFYYGGANQVWLSNNGVATLRIRGDFLELSSGTQIGFSSSTVGAGADVRFRRTAVKTVTFDDGAAGAAVFNITGDSVITSTLSVSAGVYPGGGSRASIFSGADGVLTTRNNAASRTLTVQSVDTPTCTSNCGTSPTSSGVGSSFDIIMGSAGVPASGFVITFATAWTAAPQCVGSMGTTGMVVGKLPLTLVTTTTTLTVVTNGTAPSVNDRYHFKCSLGQ